MKIIKLFDNIYKRDGFTAMITMITMISLVIALFSMLIQYTALLYIINE